MVARWYHADINGDFVEITDRVARVGWEIREQAEEGSAAMSTVTFDDPDMDWDPEPWRNWYVLEDESEDANSMLCGGWTAEQEVGREGDEWTQPLARVWQVGHTDANTYWSMRVMVGSDANRPAETDVERMQWLLATNEVAWALDVTTYVQTTTPISMDAVDYRGQYLAQIMDDCAQASGRNWYAWIDYLYDVRTVTVWYGHDDWAVRDSALSLSNDPGDWTNSALEDGTSLVWPISFDTKLNRDPSRWYDGVYLQYDGGAVYRDLDPRTVRRDFISPQSNVKSSAKAIARANRYLAELDEQDLVITTSVELPAAKATMIRAGMRLKFRATHLPGFDMAGTWTWCRVLSCSVTPISAGERYRLTLELSPVVAVFEGDAFASILYVADTFPSPSPVMFDHTGDVPPSGWYLQPSVGALSPAAPGAGGYYAITCTANMTVRVAFKVHWAHVATEWDLQIWVYAEGATGGKRLIGTDTEAGTGGLAYRIGDLTVDVSSFALFDDDTVYAEWAVNNPAYGYRNNPGSVNDTYLQVGRGTHLFNDDTITWVGP